VNYIKKYRDFIIKGEKVADANVKIVKINKMAKISKRGKTSKALKNKKN
jgi:hypothetical protein